ncbi:MAG: hypothetical protein K6T85_01780, partial [Gorillibacterium sp.]|nr:hypothetical protein [Gorillibacterium sp.]
SSLAEQRKKLENEMEQLRSQYDEALQNLQQWQRWWEIEGQYLTGQERQQSAEDYGLSADPQVYHNEVQALRRDFALAKQQYDNTIRDLSNKANTLEGALRLQHELFMLKMQHPDMDVGRVLTTAREKGLNNLELAYKLAYDDELRSKMVEEQVQQRLQDELSRRQSESSIVETTQSTRRYSPPETPKSYGQASDSLLSALRQSGSKWEG